MQPRFLAGFPLVLELAPCQLAIRYMKTSFRTGIFASALLLASAVASQSQTGTPEFDPLGVHDGLPKLIRVQMEFIEVSHEQLTELMFGEKAPVGDEELRKQIAQLIKEGKASILETMLCTARSGQKATSESIEEFIYPTEYEPAELPITIVEEGKTSVVLPTESRRDYATGPTPTAFETRNLGSTLEIEPTLSFDEKIIDLRFLPEIVYHVGNEIWAEWKGQYGNALIQMPKFYKISVNSSVTLADGKTMLVAALSPKDEQGRPDRTRKLMVFVKADVITTGR